MPLRPETCRTFTRTLYAGWLETVTLLKRGDDELGSVVTPYTLYDCVLPGTVVEGDAEAVSKSFYSGEAVELCSSFGSVVRCTINHPILTDKGFIPAGRVEPGTNLLSRSGDVERFTVEVQDRPAVVEKVFETITERPHHLTTRVAKSFDFHGDGVSINGKIDVVRADGELMKDVIPCRSQCLSKFPLDGLYLDLSGKNSVGIFDSLLQRVNRTDSGVMQNRKSFGFSPFRHSVPFDDFSLAATSEFYSTVIEDGSDYVTIGQKISTKRFNRFPGDVPLGDTCPVLVGVRGSRLGVFFASNQASTRTRPQRNSRFYQPISNASASHPEISRKLIRAFPGEISLDVATKIRRFHYKGPVYNLETSVGYYAGATVGSKIFLANCRPGQIWKTGEPIAGQMSSDHRRTWHIPRRELDRVGVHYINVLDRIVDKEGRYWQPESTTRIGMKLALLEIDVDCLLTDPPVGPSVNG